MPMFKKSLLILLILALAALGGTMYGSYAGQQAIALDEGTSENAAAPRTVVVYVTGEVKKPGLVTLTEGQRVADAVNAVGGVIETADIERVNMAALLEDGMQIRVPERIGRDAERPRNTQSGKTANGPRVRRSCRSFPVLVPPCLHASLSTARQTDLFKVLKM